MSDRLNHIKHSIAHFSQKLDQKGFVANHDGNITVKIKDGFLATPTAVSKASIVEEMVITLDANGKKIEGVGSPFGELKLHLAAYKTRPDAQAVVHAHPPFATARGLVGHALYPKIPEAIVSIGSIIPIAPMTLPGSLESERAVEDALQISDVCMLAGNGVLAIGADVEQAYLRLELVEHLCKIESYAGRLGLPLDLPKSDVDKLLEKRKALGLGPQANGITRTTATSSHSQSSLQDDIKKIIVEEIKKALVG